MTTCDFSSLSGRVVLVTGGAGHIGSTLASAFLQQGCSVVTADLMESPAFSDIDGCHTHLRVDLADLAVAAELPSRVLHAFGRLDIVVCAAAFVGTSASEGWTVPFEEQDESMWDHVLAVNLTANFALIKAAAEPLAASGVGSVILVSSTYAIVAPQPSLYEGLPINNPAGYAVSKAGVTQLARWLSTAMAPEVRVNALTPGGVYRNHDPEFVRRYENLTPLARMASEDDFVGPALFLASDLARYVTGHDLVVDGGFSVW
jgi:NAD(P)-dependent dehydrogenase (short-subunit alcohol dehydrogenase family)